MMRKLVTSLIEKAGSVTPEPLRQLARGTPKNQVQIFPTNIEIN